MHFAPKSSLQKEEKKWKHKKDIKLSNLAKTET